MAKKLNILTHLQQAQATNELTCRLPQPGTVPWIDLPRQHLKIVVEPRRTISIGAPKRPGQPHRVRIIRVAQAER